MAQTQGFVVLLRGVNVGKSRRVPMADFKSVLGSLGLQDVQTLLNSGNAVAWASDSTCTASALARRIAEELQTHLGFVVPVVVQTADQLQAIVAGNRLIEDATFAAAFDPSRLLVAFTQEPAQATALGAPLQALLIGNERLHVGAQALYLHCTEGVLKSKAGAALVGKLGQGVTTRNWATVLKLQALMSAPR